MTLIITIASLTLLASFICSLFEAVLYSLTPTQVEVMRKAQRFGAEKLAALRRNVEEPIAAILTINTIAHTVGAAVCGSLVGEEYDSFALGVFTAVFTVAVLVVTEIIPKSIGVRFAPSLGPVVAWPLQGMVWTAWPIAIASRWLMHKLTGAREDAIPSVDEILFMARMARAGGELRESEVRWVQNALRLDGVTAADIMTPRTVVESLAADTTVGEVTPRLSELAHTRLPITEAEGLDGIVGMVHLRGVLEASSQGRTDVKLREIAKQIDFVPETIRGHKLLDKLLAEKKHMVAVVDEYGGFEGIVTLEDVLECLLGYEIVDEHDRHEDMQEVARRRAELLAQRRARDTDAADATGS